MDVTFCEMTEEEGEKQKDGKDEKQAYSYQLLVSSDKKLQDEGRVKGQCACLVVTLLKPFWPILGLPPRRDFQSLGHSWAGLGKTGALSSVP